MNYKIGDLMGQGKFGAVYSGESSTGECVAIKMEPASKHNGLKRETAILNYLYHAGCRYIPNVYWFGVYNQSPCLVMTCYECSLYELGRVSENSAKSILKQMNTILDCIHSHSVIHRDIKPHNFMIKNKELFIIDFGLAVFEPTENTTHIIGTPSYVSVNIHQGKPATQTDDRLSLQYIYMYLTEGLPWTKDVPTNDLYEGTHILHPKNQYIYNMKLGLICL